MTHDNAPFSADDFARALELLEVLADDRRPLAVLDEETRKRFVIAAGRVSRPDRKAIRDFSKTLRKREKLERRNEDAALLDAAGVRALRRAPIFITPPELPPEIDGPIAPEELHEARKCYVCKREFRTVHFFYDQMCGDCGDFNWQKRNQTADLRGRVALVTGSRVKIGYQAAIKLLRAGAHVIVSTRFPNDAAERYAREEDFPEWKDRLEIHGLDLRHTPTVESFAKHLLASHSRLDFILNNACQTVRRPPAYYAHMMEAEAALVRSLPGAANKLLESHRDHLASHRAHDSAALSQIALVEGDEERSTQIFPTGALDADLQQIDLRTHNSWRLLAHEVPTIELLEVQLVNAVAPFVLNARLRPLMQRTTSHDKHIVNVSAMEGQFYRAYKTDRHPHTNMAKAALNMLTRTSAADYVKDGIHMNSVDTGWVTDEDPAHLAVKKVEMHGFHPPLDIVDGAARIVAPLFDGLNTGEHVFGLFLKDYKPTPW